MADDSVGAAHVDSLLKVSEDVVSKLEEEHLALKTIVEEEFSALLQAVLQRKQAVLEGIDKDKEDKLAQVEEYAKQCKENTSDLTPLLSKPLPQTKCGVLVGTWSVTGVLPCVRVLPALTYTVGSELPVQVLGAVSTTGKFVVRVVHPPGEQEACLRDISDMISYDLGREPTPPISEPQPGDLCCARYHGDNKWYRARVESVPQSAKVKVFLLDFGSILDSSTNELLPLKEKYKQYPFQVLLCALSEEPVTLPREAKWRFGDVIRSRSLTVNIIKELNHGYEYIVSLWTQPPQPVNISEEVLRLAKTKEAQRESHPILHRDVRLKNVPPTSGTSSKDAPPPKQVDVATGSTMGTKRIDLDLKGVTVLQRPKPKPDVPGPKPDVQEPKPDVQEPKPDVQEPKPDVQEPKPNLQEPKPNIQESKPDERDSTLKPGQVEATTEVPGNSASSGTPENAEMVPKQSVTSTHHDQPAVEGEKHSSVGFVGKHPKSDTLVLHSLNDGNGAGGRAKMNRTGSRRAEQKVERIDLHPSLQEGHQVSLVVVSELSSRGEFWAQVAIEEEEEEEEYKTMAEELQVSVQKFFHMNQLKWPCGTTCAARFTEDKIWYRAQVETVSRDRRVTVRYIDFGNAEEVPVKYIRPLEPSFWRLPCHAVKCSISLEEDRPITLKMCQKFNELTKNSEEDPVNAKVVAVGTDVVFVQLLMEIEGHDPIDLNEEVLLSDLNAVGQLEFTLTPVEPPPTLGSWADRMDELNSPSALLPEVSFDSALATTVDVTRERPSMDWISNQKGTMGETLSFSKKESTQFNRAGPARLFQNSLRGVHLSDEDCSRERGTSPLTESCEVEEGRQDKVVEGAALCKEKRHHASDPSLVRSENWDEEEEPSGGWRGGQGHTHPRAESPWDGSHVKLFVGGLGSARVLPQQIVNLFEPQLKVHSVKWISRAGFLVTVDHDGYEAKVKELNGKVIPGVSRGNRGLVVEKSRKRKPERDGHRNRRT